MNDVETFRVDIYGHIIDKALAHKLQKFSFVQLKGYQRDIPYKSYKILLHTSISESFGMVFCEAIYNGLPVICFDVGGAKEIVEKQNGFLIEPYNIDEMISAIRKSLVKKITVDPNSVSQYSWEEASKSYLKILQ